VTESGGAAAGRAAARAAARAAHAHGGQRGAFLFGEFRLLQLELAQLLLLHLALHVHERVGASLPERGPMSGQPIFGHREGESLALELRLRLGGLGLPALSDHRGVRQLLLSP
jgi:hypothetical protein